MGDLSLDVDAVQVLINYPADADGFYWHHRLLLHRITGGTWLCLTPDHEIQRHDLGATPHRIIERRSRFPEDIADEIYAHDPIGKAQLNAFMRQAKIQAAILGDGDVGEPEAFDWVVSEPQHPKFGTALDPSLINNGATGLAFTSKGVIIEDGEEIYVERVLVKDLEDWRKKKVLEGGDDRLLGDHRDASGRRRLDLASAVELMKETEDKEFPISGIRAAKEYHDSVASGPGNFLSYHAEWLRLSGVAKRASAAHIHRSLCEALRLMHSHDQIDASTTAVGEFLARWAVQTELAVERNPSQPDYSGLDIISGASVQADGRATTSKFSEWVTGRLKERAQVWKQERLYNQERRSLRGKGGGGGAAGNFSSISSKAADACVFPEFDLRWRTAHRKHGEPFPLPRVGRPTAVSPLTRRVDSAFGALNQLAAAVFDKADSEDLRLTAVQAWMMNDLQRRIQNYGECPADLNEHKAISDLTSNANLYDQEALNIADYDINEIKILQRRLTPFEARELAPPEAQSFLNNFSMLVERPGHELEGLRNSGELVKPHWDERLRCSKALRIELYQRLHQCGLLTFRRRQKAKVGMFTVKKKGNRPGNTQRLIVDCQQANYLQRRPATTRLATPAGLTALDFGEETLAAAGFDGHPGETNCPNPGLETGDVGDCFYNFIIKEACSLFSTGDILNTDEMKRLGIFQDTIYDDDLGLDSAVVDGESLYVCFGGMPMGWSWALYSAQEIVSEQCRVACNAGPSELVRDKTVAPTISPGKAAIGVYVDNVHTFGGTVQDASDRMTRIQQHFEQLGIPFDVDHVSGHTSVDTLGLTFDFSGNSVVVRAKKDRAWRLWLATRSLLRRRRISGEVLRVWIGHVNFHFLLARPLLSCLSACYAFAAKHRHHRYPMWNSVRKELKIVMGLIFTVEKNLSSPINPEVYIGDSSDRGYGLMNTIANTEHVKTELMVREKWRFIVSRDPLIVPTGGGPSCPEDSESDDDEFRGSIVGAGLGLKTEYGRQLADKLNDTEHTPLFRSKKKRLLGPTEEHPPTLLEVHPVPEVSSRWTDPTRWQLLTAGPWRDVEEHINVKEARVALMGLRRLCRSVNNMGTICLSLCDNLCSVLMFEKGRSGVHSLNNLCKRAAAYQIGCSLQWRLRHIRSEDNVADEPSRRWGPDVGRGLRKRREEGNTLGEHFFIDSFEQGHHPSSPSKPKKTNADNFGATAFLELFAGTAQLSEAVEKSGCRTLPAFDVSKGKHFNLLNKGVQEVIIGLIRGRHVWCVHLGTPCTAWSRARHGIVNFKKARKKEHFAVATALFSVRVIRECIKHGVRFTLENPTSSRLWQFKPIEDLFTRRDICFFTFDHCRFGMSYRKRTSLMTNEPAFKALGLLCQGGHTHVHLKGSAKVEVEGKLVYRNRTRMAGAYPPRLCRQWAQIIRQLGGPGSKGKLGSTERHEFEQLLVEAGGSADRKTSQSADAPDHPNWQGEADCDPKLLNEAKDFIKRQPVVFGQFTRSEIEREYASKNNTEKTERQECSKRA
eukprot:s490_g23.t1